MVSPAEAAALRGLAETAVARRPATAGELCQEVRLVASRVPRPIRRVLARFTQTGCGYVVLAGCLQDMNALPATPADWSTAPGYPESLVREDLVVLMLASLVGHPFAWASQQDGRLVHNIVPTPADAHLQLGSSSAVHLEWHTEDAFHPCRGDYLILVCLRNPTRTPTQIGVLNTSELARPQLACLRERRFYIAPDESHYPHRSRTNRRLHGDHSTIEALMDHPEPTSLVSGSARRPVLRADRCYTSARPGDAEATAALDAMIHAIDANLQDVTLAPGDACIIDNRVAVHGRPPFHAAHNRADRWLKRVNAIEDIDRLRAHGLDAMTRTI
jgi:Fe(II)/alpha-ketoglutarate-dependent arginine beta-hydroxylase